jgi:uncharacterized protein YjbI with pentapeptide repeats
MANQEQVMYLLSGAEIWNDMRQRSKWSRIDLSYSNLREAKLSGTNLNSAILINSNLSDADLSWAKLSWVNTLTQEQLDQVQTCRGATLPEGLTCNGVP